MNGDRDVTITADDIEFLKAAKRHYGLFADQVEKEDVRGEDGSVIGLFRKQEFYAERFLARIGG